jgi:hypothetical protein
MSALTRRRIPDARQESWLVYYGDVRVGTIATRSGNPTDTDPWGWTCGFYPDSHPREYTFGTAATFDQARADFAAAWRIFPSNRTEGDFQEWREQRDRTARKYAMWEAGERLPSQRPNSIIRCTCCESFDSHRLDESLIHVPHLSAAMKFVEPNPFTDPDATARKLLEIANATEPAQDGRIYIELVNAAFLKRERT